MSDYIKLQSRCQRGEASLSGANNLLAECHAALGRLIAENESAHKHWQNESNNVQVLVAEVARLKAENEALREEVALDDKLIADRDRLLNMFECPVHGQCIPYAMEQVEELRKDAHRLQSAATFVQKLCDSAGTQPSVATGYLHDILAAMGQGEKS